jgi:hypothetical protein
MSFKRVLASVLFAPMILLPQAMLAGEYLPGDFHQHSLYTDGSNRFMDVMAENANYGLAWWANSEHGGERNRDGYGNYWDDPAFYPVNPILGDVEFSGGHQEMWRWQSLRDYVYPDILTTRANMPDKTVVSGLEWNVPSHEHCSTAIYQYDGTANAISEFEFRFDASDDDTSRNGEASLLSGLGPLSKTNDTKDDAIAAVDWMQALHDQGIGDAWVVPAHIERARRFYVEDFRNWNNAGPDVAFGFEGAPGHQTSGDRGFGRSAEGGGTYGGSGAYSGKVGDVWDALLGEGRNWWNFASSDYHAHWTVGGSDFWPGEYQKNYTYIETENPDKLQAVFDGVRSGNSFHVEGDLIDELEFTAHGKGKEKAVMGQTLVVTPGTMVTVKIKVHDPNGINYCPLDMDNPSLAQIGVSQPLNMPVLDHVDLISGEWGSFIDPRDEEAYTDGTNPTAGVVATFKRHGGVDKNGYMTYVFKFKAENNVYFRLRGTNLPAGVPYETDAMGNPLADSEANDNLYSLMSVEDLEDKLFDDVTIYTNSKLDEVAEAYADLWFYSNPIFIQVEDGNRGQSRKAGR